MKREVFSFSLPLVRPLALAGGMTLTEREGFLLRENGRWAEASPLPGFSRERLGDVEADLAVWVARGERAWTASVQFALNCLGDGHGDFDGPFDVPVSGLLHGKDVAEEAARLQAAGVEAVKIKVGHRGLDGDAKVVREAREALPDVRLRLDVNRQWNMRQALKFHRRVGNSFEYVEEPLAHPGHLGGLAELAKRTGWRIALDETLREEGEAAREVEAALPDAVWVVKPMMSPERLVAGRELVISSSFESGVGLAHLARLAARHGGEPAGLDTGRWLAEDVLVERLRIEEGRLRVEGPLEVDVDRLEAWVSE